VKLQKIVANDVEIHYFEEGRGVPLVLIHGGLADYREWGPQVEQFAQHYLAGFNIHDRQQWHA
jgi:pimeloyl-ACP methyl ester carboxylesterase